MGDGFGVYQGKGVTHSELELQANGFTEKA